MNKYFRIGISAVLLTFIGWQTNWSDVGAKFASLRVELWFAAVAVLMCTQLFSAKRWQMFTRRLHFPVGYWRCTAYYFIGTYFNLLLPTSVGGDVMRVLYLDNKSGRKLAALASVFLERLNGLLVLIALGCVGVLVSPLPLPIWIHATVWSVAGCATLGVLALPIAATSKWLPDPRRHQLQTVVGLMKLPRVWTLATAMSILVQVFGVISVWLIGQALNLNLPFTYCCILSPMVSLLTLLPISVNGMGVREVGTIVFLAPLGIDADSAKTLAFLWFAVNVAVSLSGGLVYLAGTAPKSNKDEVSQSPEVNDDGSVDRYPDQGRTGESKAAA
ncbi:MAG: flippase-like domain-containing protein [Gemmataceae bacterium]|nr:flippase-like domain-containing protein [Gemmataceae bacterium]